MSSLRGLAVVAIALGSVWRIDAQATTNAVCIVDPWTSNAEGSSPCLVAAVLQGACHGGIWNVPAITSGSEYVGPLLGESNKCQCSSVVYSMVSACAVCQGGDIETWNLWITNCTPTDISVSSYPLTLPSSVSVPSWAYLNVSVKGVWDSTAALNTHNSGAPDSSAISPTATASTNSASSTSSGTNAGAIAGGVVGGVVGLALIALAVFLFLRRRRRAGAVPASAQFAGAEKVDLVGHSPTFGEPHNPPMVMPGEALRLYNPSDPSTFPVSPPPSLPGHLSGTPVPSTPYTATSALYSSVYAQSPTATNSHSHFHAPSQSSHGYTGVPEI